MKRLTFILILLALVWPGIAQAQGPIYLPVVTKMASCEPTWKFITPDGTTNEVLNPSFEIAGNYVAAGGGALTRTAEYGAFGLYGLRVVTAANGDGVTITTATLANAEHYVTMRVRGALPAAWTWTIGAGIRAPRLIESIDGVWSLYGARFTAAECNGQTTLIIRQSGAGAGDFYLDAIQVEQHSYWTTYCDGTQEGCAWDGAEHASSSTRSAESRAGGIVRDFWDDYGFFVEEAIGVGASSRQLSSKGYALLPGGELSGVKIQSRQFTLTGRFIADSEAELHANRQALLIALAPESYPQDDEGYQPVRVRYSGALVQKGIAATYDGGLEGQFKASYGPWQVEGEREWRNLQKWQETAAIRFFADDPLWYEVLESAAELDLRDDTYFREMTGRLKATEQWDDLGPPNAAGTYVIVYAMAEDDTYIYIGGNFQDWDNDPNADRIARYNKQTGVWSGLGVGLDGNVRGLAIGPDGTLYAGGEFTDVVGGGGGTYNYIIAWDPVTETWSALGAGMDNWVYAITFGLDGTLYAGGAFTTAGGPAAQKIAQWNSLGWSAVGAGLNNTVFTLTTGKDGTIYAGGVFDDVFGGGGGTYNHIIAWDPVGAAYSALGTGMNNDVYALVVGIDGTLYAGGHFTTAGGVTVNYIAQWNGSVWTGLGSGMSNDVWALSIGPDEFLYASGSFATADGITLPDYIARWNGSAWAALDASFPGTSGIVALLASQYADPVIVANYDLFVPFNAEGIGVFAGLITATNGGSSFAYPRIVFNRTDSRQLAQGLLETTRNERTGKLIQFDYGILPGERLTVDLFPTERSVISNFFGSRPDAVVASSDFGTWGLRPSNNNVSAFIYVIPDERNDTNGQLSEWLGVTGLDETNTDDGRLYVSVIDDGGGFFHVELYNDAARGAGDLVGHTNSYNAAGLQAIIEDNASGVGGYIYIDAAAAQDLDIYVDFALTNGHMIWKDAFDSLD